MCGPSGRSGKNRVSLLVTASGKMYTYVLIRRPLPQGHQSSLLMSPVRPWRQVSTEEVAQAKHARSRARNFLSTSALGKQKARKAGRQSRSPPMQTSNKRKRPSLAVCVSSSLSNLIVSGYLVVYISKIYGQPTTFEERLKSVHPPHSGL